MADKDRLKRQIARLKAELAARPSPEDVAKWLDEEGERLARGGSGLDAGQHKRIAQVIRFRFGPPPTFPCVSQTCDLPGLCTDLKRCRNERPSVPSPKPSDPMPEDISLTNE